LGSGNIKKQQKKLMLMDGDGGFCQRSHNHYNVFVVAIYIAATGSQQCRSEEDNCRWNFETTFWWTYNL